MKDRFDNLIVDANEFINKISNNNTFDGSEYFNQIIFESTFDDNTYKNDQLDKQKCLENAVYFNRIMMKIIEKLYNEFIKKSVEIILEHLNKNYGNLDLSIKLITSKGFNTNRDILLPIQEFVKDFEILIGNCKKIILERGLEIWNIYGDKFGQEERNGLCGMLYYLPIELLQKFGMVNEKYKNGFEYWIEMINTIKQLSEQLNKFVQKYKLISESGDKPLIFKQIETISIKIQNEAGISGKSF